MKKINFKNYQVGYGPRTDRKETTIRTCICCKKEFKSEGRHNQVCDPCKSTRAWKDGNEELAGFSFPTKKGRPE